MSPRSLAEIRRLCPASRYDLVFDESGTLIAVADKAAMANQSEQRQAGTEIQMIEVTPAMIRAGLSALGGVDVPSWDDEQDVVSRVYRAMATAQSGRATTGTN